MEASSPRTSVAVIKDASLVAMYSAVAVASSLALVTIPNLETISLFIFFVSYRHGWRRGLNMAVLTLVIYEFTVASVWGSAGLLFLFKFPPQFLTVLTGALLGSLTRKEMMNQSSFQASSTEFTNSSNESLESVISTMIDAETEKKNRWIDFTAESIIFGLLGFTLTLIYDVFTSLSFLIFTPEIRSESLLMAFLLGVPFYLFHEITNFILFSTVPLLNEALDAVSQE